MNCKPKYHKIIELSYAYRVRNSNTYQSEKVCVAILQTCAVSLVILMRHSMNIFYSIFHIYNYFLIRKLH